MERREFTRFHLYMIIAALVGIITIIWATVAIINIKKNEELNANKVNQPPVVIQQEKEEEPELPEDFKEPDLTLQEYNARIVKIKGDNTYRYDRAELNDIINKYIQHKDADGNPVELNLEVDASLNDALITNGMYERCMSVWLPKENCLVVIVKADVNQTGEITTNLRKYAEFMERSSSTNEAIYNFRYTESYSYNNYTVFLACNNAMDLLSEIQNYMVEKDLEAVESFEKMYELTEYGAYLKDSVETEITEEAVTEETEDGDIITEETATEETVTEETATEDTVEENKEVENETMEDN